MDWIDGHALRRASAQPSAARSVARYADLGLVDHLAELRIGQDDLILVRDLDREGTGNAAGSRAHVLALGLERDLAVFLRAEIDRELVQRFDLFAFRVQGEKPPISALLLEAVA